MNLTDPQQTDSLAAVFEQRLADLIRDCDQAGPCCKAIQRPTRIEIREACQHLTWCAWGAGRVLLAVIGTLGGRVRLPLAIIKADDELYELLRRMGKTDADYLRFARSYVGILPRRKGTR